MIYAVPLLLWGAAWKGEAVAPLPHWDTASWKPPARSSGVAPTVESRAGGRAMPLGAVHGPVERSSAPEPTSRHGETNDGENRKMKRKDTSL